MNALRCHWIPILLGFSAALSSTRLRAEESPAAAQPATGPEGMEDIRYYIRKEGLYGFIDRQGNVVVPPKYQEVHPSFSEGLAGVRLGEKWGFVGLRGNVTAALRFEEVMPFSEGRAAARFNGKWGFLDKAGAWVAETRYSAVHSYAGGLARVAVHKGQTDSGLTTLEWGYLDLAGKEAIPLRFAAAELFQEDRAAVNLGGKWGWGQVIGGKWGFIDPRGELVIGDDYDQVTPFFDGLAAVRKGDAWGYIDPAGKAVIPLNYRRAAPFENGRAIVTTADGKAACIDKKAALLVPPKYDKIYPFVQGMAKVLQDLKYGFINEEGKEVVPPQYAQVLDFSEGLAAVQPQAKGKWNFIDSTGKVVIETPYFLVRSFSEGLAQVLAEATYTTVGSVHGQWNYMDKTGTLPFRLSWTYESLPFKDGYAIGRFIDKQGVVDRAGKWAIRPAYRQMERVDGGILRVFPDASQMGYIDFTGKVIWQPTQ